VLARFHRGVGSCDACGVHMQAKSRAVQVLIVDDQASFRRAARGVVELTDGFDVAGEVTSGEASVEAARVLRPDLVLMDVHLSGIDGLEACRQIRSTAVGVRPVIFLLSTYEAVEFAERTAECGAATYLPKAEFAPERLASAWSAIRGST
jgi:two-component system, NarL family, invasion response regulator UvrY